MYAVYFYSDGIAYVCRFATLEEAADFRKLTGGIIR